MEVREALATRRAINFFDKNKGVGRNTIKEMIEMALQAPSSFNLQPWQLMVLTDQEEKDRLRKLAMNQPKISEAPVVLIFLADRTGWQEGHPWMERNFQEMVKRGLPEDRHGWFTEVCTSLYGWSEEASLAFACKNTGFFAMAVMLAARQLGLHTHPMDGFDHNAVKEAFNIPENYWVPLLMAVGHFDESQTLEPPKWRKSFDEVVVKF